MKDGMVSSIEATAEYLGLTTEELQSVIDAGRLRVVRPHTEPMIHEADLEAYMRESLKQGPKKLITSVPLISIGPRKREENTG